MIYTFNRIGNGGSAVTNKISTTMINSGNGHADNGKLKLTWSGGATLTLTFGTAEVSAAVGYGSTTTPSGLSSSHTLPNVVHGGDYFWEPSYPVLGYQRGTTSAGGYTATTLKGGVFSIRGNDIKTVKLSVNVGYSAGYVEWLGWINLWKRRWLLGRSVAYIPDPTSYSFSRSTLTVPADPVMGVADPLVSLEAGDVTAERLIREKESVFTSGPFSMGIKPAPSLLDGHPSSRIAYRIMS